MVTMKTEYVCIRLVSPVGMTATLMAEMMRRLKAPDPTMRLGPNSSCLKSLKRIPMMDSKISGAERGPASTE